MVRAAPELSGALDHSAVFFRRATGRATAIVQSPFPTLLPSRDAMNIRLRSMALVAAALVATLVVPLRAHGGAVAFVAKSASELTRSAAGCVSELTQTWICDRSDNICGLDDPRMLSKPCKVDYDALLKATPEMKKIVNDKIDPNSSEGINLRQKAVDRIRDKAEAVRVAQGYCSVWKAISHKDGRTIPDITDLVKAQL